MFSMGFRSSPFMGSMAQIVGTPVMLNLTYEQIQAMNYRPLFERHTPRGYTTVFPYVVKLADGTGEFLVYADKSIQWTRYGSGHVSAPFYAK